MFTLSEKLFEKIEENGFSIADGGNGKVWFEKCTATGRTFKFSVELGENTRDLARNILKLYDEYEISDGAGIPNVSLSAPEVPYEVEDYIHDIRICSSIIFELYEIVLKGEIDEEEEDDDSLTPTEKLEEYIRENFEVSIDAQRIIRNICDYAAYHYSGEDLVVFLGHMLVGTIGLTGDEIRKIVC